MDSAATISQEYVRDGLRRITAILEVLAKRANDQEMILNEIKLLLIDRNVSRNQSSFNPVDFLARSHNESALDEGNDEKQSNLTDSNNNEENSNGIVCFDCMQSFKRGDGTFTKHCNMTNCKPFSCDTCLKLFKKRSNMLAHKMTHLKEDLSCDKCDSVFKCQKYLKNHQNRKHKITIESDTSDKQKNVQEPSAKKMKLLFDDDD